MLTDYVCYLHNHRGKTPCLQCSAQSYKVSERVPPTATDLTGKPLPAPRALDVQVGGRHYKDMKIQPVEFITANGIGFLEGCVIKRVCRWRSKDGLQDLEKAKHELDLLIEQEKKRIAGIASPAGA